MPWQFGSDVISWAQSADATHGALSVRVEASTYAGISQTVNSTGNWPAGTRFVGAGSAKLVAGDTARALVQVRLDYAGGGSASNLGLFSHFAGGWASGSTGVVAEEEVASVVIALLIAQAGQPQTLDFDDVNLHTETDP